MKIREFNKASATAVAGALVTLAGTFWVMDQAVMGALHTILTTILVFKTTNETPKAPNKE